MRKPVFGVSDQVPHKPACTKQKMARGLKVRIKEEEGLYYLCSENKSVDQLRGKLICVFVFAYAKSRFSHDAAHMYVQITCILDSVKVVEWPSFGKYLYSLCIRCVFPF